ncbi:MAG: hypothetical protein P8Y02_03330 [Deinococcales bacterium]
MRLVVLTPTETVLATSARSVTAEGLEGGFGMRPRHIGYVAALLPGLLSFVDDEGTETFVATGDGVLVKVGDEVRVACAAAVVCGSLGAARETLHARLRSRDDRELRARRALDRLEAELVRRMVELEAGHGR